MKTLYIAVLWLLAALAPVNPASAAEPFRADANINVTSNIIANNTTAIVIATKAATVYMIEAYNNATTLAFIKLYNAASGVTCGQTAPAPIWRGMIPFGATSSGGAILLPNINGDAYSNGVTLCVTTGIADSDTGAPAASTYIVNVHWKPMFL